MSNFIWRMFLFIVACSIVGLGLNLLEFDFYNWKDWVGLIIVIIGTTISGVALNNE